MTHFDHTNSLSVADIEKLALLSRLALTEEEKTGFAKDIGNILSYVAQIQEVSAPQGDQSIPDRTSKSQYAHRNIMREDITSSVAAEESTSAGVSAQPMLNPDPKILVESAPRHTDGYIQVKKILGGSQ